MRGRLTLWRCENVMVDVNSVEWYTCFPGNVAQIFNHGWDQRHSFFPPFAFGFSLGIAGNQRTSCARRWLRGTKHANILIHLYFERVRLNESIDPHRAKEMPDALTDAARGRFDFRAESKRRGERPPIRATQNATQHIDHDSQAVALMSSALAIRAKRQKRSAHEHIVGPRRD